MKVILKEDIKGTGQRNEVIEVAEGFARNYLLPKGLAVEATPGNLRDLTQKKENWAQKQAGEIKQAQQLAEQLAKVVLTIPVKVGEGGRLFGSIGNRDIAELLAQEKGLQIERRQIIVEGAIKELGTYQITVKLHTEVSVKIEVRVVEAVEERG